MCYGNIAHSKIIKQFKVNVGRKTEPTPLPYLCGKQYWKIIKIIENDVDFPPYFLELDISFKNNINGPLNYIEDGQIKNWNTIGPFGLHNKKIENRLRVSAGCIRHTTEDIIYIANILKKSNQKTFRYYIL